MAHDDLFLPDEGELRLCGDVQGKRVIDLGSGAAHAALTFARMGAKVLAVESSAERVLEGRRAAEADGVKVEYHQGDLADLGFATSASVDAVFSAGALAGADDLARLVRQVHRVLKPGAPFVFTVPHPAATMLDGGGSAIVRSYGADGRTVAGYFTVVTRADFQIDTVQESMGPGDLVPSRLVMRARKLGV